MVTPLQNRNTAVWTVYCTFIEPTVNSVAMRQTGTLFHKMLQFFTSGQYPNTQPVDSGQDTPQEEEEEEEDAHAPTCAICLEDSHAEDTCDERVLSFHRIHCI